VFVGIFSGDDKVRGLNQRLFTDIRQAGGNSELIGETSTFESFRLPEHDAVIRPILEILPIQMITLVLAALAGREAGRFERATKITTTE
jgi:glucosamine--fructose-6-phosphate aminotransferase (isomerizing)